MNAQRRRPDTRLNVAPVSPSGGTAEGSQIPLDSCKFQRSLSRTLMIIPGLFSPPAADSGALEVEVVVVVGKGCEVV